MSKPTDEDMARDLAADLADIREARPGPWTTFDERTDIVMDGQRIHRFGVMMDCPDDGEQHESIVCTTSAALQFQDTTQAARDASMIADARTGWPAAIRRAMHAEAELKRLLSHTYCAYCGFSVDMDADAALVSGHIATCEKHPMRDVEARRDALAAMLAAAEQREKEHLHELAMLHDELAKARQPI